MAEGHDGAEARAAREVTQRAIRRLGVMETVLMLAAGLLALLAGALAAWLVADVTGWPFRPVWIAASVIFFVVPGGTVLIRARRDEAERRARLERATSTDD